VKPSPTLDATKDGYGKPVLKTRLPHQFVHLAMLASLCLAGSVGAQEPAKTQTTTDRETIRELVQEVKRLQDKVAALEEKQISAPVPPAPADINSTPSSQDAPIAGQDQAATFEESHEVRGIRWRGFGEVNYKVLNQREPELAAFGFVPGSAGNFYSGDFDLFLTSKLGEKASILAEVVIGEGDAQSFSVDLARALLKYDYNDHLRMSFGRYHTSIGFYNTAFHSGRWLQTTVDRPLIMEFADDGGLLPTQALGLSFTGQIPSGKWGANYIFEYGSSDTIRPDSDGGGTFDENNGNHVNAGFFLRPEAAPGLQLGASWYHDRISDLGQGPSVRLGQTIVNAHVVYTGHGVEFLSEGFLIRNAYEGRGPTFNIPAFYAQFSKRLRKTRPFFRYQYVNANANSIYHDDVLLRHGSSFGARYDFTDSIAFKMQLDHTVRKSKPDLNGLQVQVSFAF